jgi:hypothetical protein
MATKFKHLEFLPLDEENLVVNDNPESNLQGKSCLNLGFNALNSLNRLININNINNTSTTNQINFLNLSYNLESLLGTILNINSIANISNTELSNHYLKRQNNITNNKILPSFSYCQNLTFTRFKTWAGFYGTLSYYINLLEEYNEYSTPSQIAYFSIKSLFEYSIQVLYNANLNSSSANRNNNLLIEFYRNSIELFDKDSLESDKDIYNLSINIILNNPLTRELYNELTFYEDWLKKIINWKTQLDISNTYTIKNNPESNKERAINTLLQCINIMQEEGFDTNNIKNLSAGFIHQNYPNNLNDLHAKLTNERNNITYIKIDGQLINNTEELLIVEFIDNISKFRKPYDFKNACNFIQEFYCPPGGYSLLTIALATCLINRAYIISYENINNNEDLSISNNYKRIIKLLGLASILLIKSNNSTAQIIGENILKTFEIYIEDIDPTNLLDNYK